MSKKQPKIYRALNRFGLSDNEIKVYLECIASPDTTPYKVSKSTGIARSTVYDILMNLALRKLVTLDTGDEYSKMQTKIRATNPSNIRKELWKREDEARKLDMEMLDIMTDLKQQYHTYSDDSNHEVLSGAEGVAKIYNDIDFWRPDIEVMMIDCMIPLESFGRHDLDHGMDQMTDILISNKSRSRQLIHHSDWTQHVFSYQIKRNPKYLEAFEYRVIDSPLFDYKLETVIKGDYVRHICVEGDEIWATSTKSSANAQANRSMFEMLWANAVPLEQSGIVKSK